MTATIGCLRRTKIKEEINGKEIFQYLEMVNIDGIVHVT